MSEKLFYALEYRDLNLLRTQSEKSGNVLSFKINESGLVPVEDDEDCDLSIGRSAIYIYSSLPSTRKLRHTTCKKTDTVDSNEIRPYGDIFRLLLQIQEFEALNDEELWSLSEQAIRHHYLIGDRVFNEGEAGESLFVVASGTFHAITETENGETLTLRILGTGQCFGEMSLLTGEPRSASVVADEESVAYEINKHHLSSIMQNNPCLFEVLSELMADRHSATQQQALLQALAAENNRTAGNLMKKMRDFFGQNKTK